MPEVVRRTSYSRTVVRQILRGERTDVSGARQSPLDAHLPISSATALFCRRAPHNQLSDVQIGVVHAVQPPKRWHGVEQHMLEIDGKVEREKADDDAEPVRRRH